MRKLLVSFLRLSSLLMLSTLLAGGEAAAAAFGALAVLFPVGLMALGALRDGRLGRAWIPLVALAVVLEAGFWTLLQLRGQVVDGPWVLGMPAASAVFLGLLWLGPLVLVSLAYGRTFEEHGVTEEGLERLRRAAAARRGSGAEGP